MLPYSKRVTMQDAAGATGNGTAISCLEVATLGMQVVGTFVGTVTFEATVDGTNWVSLECRNVATGAKVTSVAGTSAVNTLVVTSVAGRTEVRARVSAWTSGSITVVGFGTALGGGEALADIDIIGPEASTIADGSDIALGTTTDAAASSSVAEDTTARTGIGLWKGIKNILILLNAKFTAGTDTGDVGVKSYTTIANGELAGSATAVQMPSVACKMVKFKAVNSNAGNVYIGGSGVTKPDGTSDTTTGLELDAGEETGWLTVSNLNVFYRICDNAGDDLTYLALS